VTPGKEQKVLKQILELLNSQDITPMDGGQWESWVKDTHEKADRPFSYSPENARKLTDILKDNSKKI
jgi:hypothetical protein